MASLNLSTNGPSISKSYQSVVNAPPPSGPAAGSPTYGQWALFSVQAPLANAFQDSANKESVLKVQSSGEGEIIDLVDEFSDGRIQFAFLKLKDTNTGLPKNALIAWCGEGVPERTKGYFTSHLTAVAKLLHGYHVQITARSDRDLSPESIISKVADASGSKYSSADAPPPVAAATKPAVAAKPAFTPTQSSGAPMPIRTGRRADPNVDEDGWGADAPQVTRTQLEKVSSAYQPTKVNMRDLTSQKPVASGYNAPAPQDSGPEVVRGAYQPVGKVDIAEIRRRAKEAGDLKDDRPETVKGSYEPVGKVDIAAIKARAQRPEAAEAIPPASTGMSQEAEEPTPSLAERSAAFSAGPERLTSMPKPKVGNKFGGGGSFAGTKAPTPGEFGVKPTPSAAAPVGAASRSFADSGGKTPAQLWAEKKARERGASGSGPAITSPSYTGAPPIAQQTSGGGGWESGYTGKKWAAVDTTHTGRSSIPSQTTGEAPPPVEEEEELPSAGGVGSIRDRFSGAPPMGAPATSSFDRAPEPETSTKPNRGIPIPGLPTQAEPAAPSLPTPPAQPRSPTPESPEREASPIRVAMPVSRQAPVEGGHEAATAPAPSLPTGALNRAVPEPEPEDDEPETGPDPGRHAAQAAAVSSLGHEGAGQAGAGGGERARAEYDYDAAEDNEISLQEGEIVTDIQRLDPDWWMVTNDKGQSGLVPSNYLEVLQDDEPAAVSAAPTTSAVPEPAGTAVSSGVTAIALYDYEAGEDNEIAFPEDAIITNISYPDEDWWLGEYRGKQGLFPAAYVKLQE